MNKLEEHFEYLEELRLRRQFLSTHGIIRNFSKPNQLIAKLKKINNIKCSTMTRKNLEAVSNMLNVKWQYCIVYNANKLGKRKGFLFYGICNNQIVNYHRKEVNSPQSGQTVMHIGTKDLQIKKLLGHNQNLKGEDIDCIFKLNEIISSLELEKILFQRL